MLPLVLALTVNTTQATADVPAVRQELLQIEERLRTTWQSDCDGWGSMLAPDWSVIHVTGRIITKAEALQMCRAPEAPIETSKVDDFAVRTFGDSAVVTGRTTATTRGPNAQTIVLRFSDFFVRRDGKWLVVASHATQLR